MNPETLEPDPDNAGVGIGERKLFTQDQIFLILRFVCFSGFQIENGGITNEKPIPSQTARPV